MAESINVRTVRRIDSSVVKIVDSAKQVQLYRFQEGTWEKTEFAGALHVCSRAAPPFFTLVIVNRLNSKSWLEPLFSKLEFQLQAPFLLYRSNQQIYGLWFYNQEECGRLSQLIETLLEEDRELTDRRKKVAKAKATARDADGQRADILRILIDANNEYLAKRRRRRYVDDDDDEDDFEEDEVTDDASDFNSDEENDVDSDVEDADEDERHERGGEQVLFRPTPVRLHPVGSDPAIVAGSAPGSSVEMRMDHLANFPHSPPSGNAASAAHRLGNLQHHHYHHSAQTQATDGGYGVEVDIDFSRFSQPPPPFPQHPPTSVTLAADSGLGQENILKKLFSNATFDLGSVPLPPVPNFPLSSHVYAAPTTAGETNVALDAVRRMARDRLFKREGDAGVGAGAADGWNGRVDASFFLKPENEIDDDDDDEDEDEENANRRHRSSTTASSASARAASAGTSSSHGRPTSAAAAVLMTPAMFAAAAAAAPEEWRPNIPPVAVPALSASPSPPKPRGRSLLLEGLLKSGNADVESLSDAVEPPIVAAATSSSSRGAAGRNRRKVTPAASIPKPTPRRGGGGPSVVPSAARDTGGDSSSALDSLLEVKEALIHVIRNNDVFVREIMEVLRERRTAASSSRNNDDVGGALFSVVASSSSRTTPAPAVTTSPAPPPLPQPSSSSSLMGAAADALPRECFLRPDWELL